MQPLLKHNGQSRDIMFQDEDAFSVAPGWKPPIPLLDEMTESKDDICPCPSDYAQVISDRCIKEEFDLSYI